MSSKVIILHSKDDRERFVLPLTGALRRVGIEVELEPWTLSGRDSLIDTIFREGLKDSAAVIVVLSRFNAAHDWTLDELEESVIDRIETVAPVVVTLLDSRSTPRQLPAKTPTFSVQRPGDLVEISSFVQELGPILTRKPAPRELQSEQGGEDRKSMQVAGLDNLQSTILALACRSAIENNSFVVKSENVFNLTAPLALESQTYRNALEAIHAAGHVNVKRANGGQISVMEIAKEAFGLYMSQVLDSLDEIVADLALEIIGGVRDTQTLIDHFELPPLVVTYILDDLDAKGHITVIRQMKGKRRIKRVSPEFVRLYS